MPVNTFRSRQRHFINNQKHFLCTLCAYHSPPLLLNSGWTSVFLFRKRKKKKRRRKKKKKRDRDFHRISTLSSLSFSQFLSLHRVNLKPPSRFNWISGVNNRPRLPSMPKGHSHFYRRGVITKGGVTTAVTIHSLYFIKRARNTVSSLLPFHSLVI